MEETVPNTGTTEVVNNQEWRVWAKVEAPREALTTRSAFRILFYGFLLQMSNANHANKPWRRGEGGPIWGERLRGR